jgi:hypothetical protein
MLSPTRSKRAMKALIGGLLAVAILVGIPVMVGLIT